MGALGTVAIAFVSGSVGAVFVNAIARYWIFQPVISIQLNRAVGSAYKTRVPPEVAEGDEKEGQFFSNGIRLRIENTGFLTLKDCRGFVTRMRRLKAGQTVKSSQEVVELGWAHQREGRTRDIPGEAFFHMDVVSVFQKKAGRHLHIRHLPFTLEEFILHPGDYEFDVMVTADNAYPKRITVKFNFDPDKDEPNFIADDSKARSPWLRRWQVWLCSVTRSVSGSAT